MFAATNTLPRITVITPSFNQVRFLERAMVSVIDQGYEQLEYIVVDGGSSDGSVDVIRRYEQDLAWWVSGPDAGPASAINRALRYATGQIVAFLDADDLYTPFALHRVAERFAAKDAPAWIVGGVDYVDADDQPIARQPREATDGFTRYLRLGSRALAGAATFYQRAALDAMGPLEVGLRHCPRFELNCRLFIAGLPPVLLGEKIAHRRLHATSMSRRDRAGRRAEHSRVAWRYVHEHRQSPTSIATRRRLRDAA